MYDAGGRHTGYGKVQGGSIELFNPDSSRAGSGRIGRMQEMEFTPLIAPQLEELLPPTAEELRILWEEIGPDRTIIGAAGV